MAKVKPYIITVKYAAFYADPAPTVEQVLNELNIDAMEITIEEAVVSAVPKATTRVEEIDVDSRTIRIYEEPAVTIPVPAQAPAIQPLHASRRRGGVQYNFDTKHLELKGPSVAILHTLQTLGPKTLAQIREITNRYDTTMQVSLSRLKTAGRVRAEGIDPKSGKTIYAFVK